MSGYSIKDLERLTNIKAHTIRIWESRYNILTPKRTESNIRVYSDDDLKLVLNIALLNKNGLKISKIAKLTKEEIIEQVQFVTTSTVDFQNQIDTLLVVLTQMDENRFVEILDYNISIIGFEETIVNIIYPFMEQMGNLWMTGVITPSQEHFISHLVRQKIISETDRLPFIKDNSKKALLFLPKSEFHEIGLLFVNYLLKKRGRKVVYLGQDTPKKDLIFMKETVAPKLVLSFFTIRFEDADKYLTFLSETFTKSEIIISGYFARQLDVSNYKNIMCTHSVDELLEKVH